MISSTAHLDPLSSAGLGTEVPIWIFFSRFLCLLGCGGSGLALLSANFRNVSANFPKRRQDSNKSYQNSQEVLSELCFSKEVTMSPTSKQLLDSIPPSPDLQRMIWSGLRL